MKKTYLLLAFLLLTISGILNVNAQTGTWTLVTSANDLAVGDQIIIAAAGYNYAISTTQNTNNLAATDITKNDDNTLGTPSGSVQIITLEQGTVATTMTYAFNVGNGYLYAASSSNNSLRAQTTNNANSSWTISIANNGTATIQASGNNTHNLLRYNTNSRIFSCYEFGQNDVVIYKFVASEPHTVTFNAGTGTCDVTELTENAGGSGITLPVAEACVNADGYTFAGWATASIAQTTTTAPTLFEANTTFHPTEDITLYAIYASETEAETTYVQKATSLSVGDIVYMVFDNYNTKKELTGINNNIGTATDYTGNDISRSYPLTIEQGSSTNSFAFKNGSIYLTCPNTNANNLTTSTTKNGYSSWTVSFDGANATVTNVSRTNRQIQYNTQSPRFACYTGTQQPVQFIKYVDATVSTTIYNSNPECSYTIGYELMQGSFVEGYNPPTSYSTGTVVTLPTADDVVLYEHHFLGWYTDWEYTDGPYTTIDETATGNKFFYAKWERNVYVVNTSVDPSNGGYVEVSPESEYEAGNTYPYGTSVTLTAIPNPGYEFTNWTHIVPASTSGTPTLPGHGQSGNQSGSSTPDTILISTDNPFTFELISDTDLIANFTPATYTIGYELMQGSFVEGYTPPTSYTYGTSVTLPTADNVELYGQTFAGWYTDWEYTDGPYTSINDTATGNKFFYAKWERNVYVVSTIVDPSNGGYVEISPESDYEAGNTYPYGTSVTLTAIPNPGYEFTNWTHIVPASTSGTPTLPGHGQSGNQSGSSTPDTILISTDNPFTFELISDTDLIANFTPATYTIGYELMQGSFVEGYTPPTSYTYGTSVTLPTADNVELYGQTFAGWYTDWEYTDGPYTSINDTATGNKFFYAKWEPIDMYTVTFDAGNGTCETAELTEQEPGGGVELPEATPCAQINGYSFAGWTDMPIDEPTTNITHLYTAGSIYKPTDNLTLYAVYSKTEDEVTTYTTNLICVYQLFVSVAPENAGTVNIDPFDYGDGYYPSNVTITLTAIPEDGYQFSFWSINDEITSTTNPLQLTLNEDTHVEANFIAVGECSAASDAEGNVYTSVNIAGSCWTTTNLVLPADNAMVYKSDMHNDEEANLDTYGYLYDWNTAIGAGATPDDNGNVQGICPTGWHIPTVTEVYAAAGLNTSTEIDDLRANGLWLDGGGNNSTGLSLLPGGYYNVDADRFDNMLSHSYFWCIDPAQPSQPKVFWADCHCYMFQVNDTTPGMGYSVRCVKD